MGWRSERCGYLLETSVFPNAAPTPAARPRKVRWRILRRIEETRGLRASRGGRRGQHPTHAPSLLHALALERSLSSSARRRAGFRAYVCAMGM